MLIVCPSCASSYSLTPEQLGVGRSLRCAKCRHTWHATPADAVSEEATDPIMSPAIFERPVDTPAEPPALEEQPLEDAIGTDRASAPDPKPAADRRSAAKPKTRKTRKPRPPFKIAAGPIAAALLVAVAACGFGLRAKVVKILPQTASLYAALGLPVNLRGLEFSGLRSELLVDKDKTILLVEGEITGVAPQSTEVPKVTVSLRGPEGREIYAWTSDVGRAALGKGESTTFRARLASPPGEGRDVVVRFAETEAHAPTH